MDREIMNRRNRKKLARSISAGCMTLGAPLGFGMYFAGVGTGEELRSLFGQKALDKSAYLFPYLCGSMKDVEAVKSVRVRYPLVFSSKMGDFDGQLGAGDRKKITKYISCVSGKKECHLNLGDDELREGSSVLNDGMQDMVDESLSYWDEKAIAAFTANGNAFDEVAFFSADHFINGTNGTKQTNLVAANVVDPTAPTNDEAAAALDLAINQLLGMQDLNGKLVNQAMKEVIVVCGTSTIANAFKGAINKVSGVAKSANVNLGITVTVIQKTGISAGKVYVLRGDASSKTVVMQETAPETRFTPSDAKDSDNWFTYTSERGVGPGVYYNAQEITLS